MQLQSSGPGTLDASKFHGGPAFGRFSGGCNEASRIPQEHCSGSWRRDIRNALRSTWSGAGNGQRRPFGRHLHVAVVLREGHRNLQRGGPRRPDEVHAEPGRRAHCAQQRRHGHHPQPVHQRFRRGGAGCAGTHHRRQRCRRLVPGRAEGNRHQEHGRSRQGQRQGAEDRHRSLQHLRADALSRAGEVRRRLQRLQHRLVQRHTRAGGSVRVQEPRPRHPRRAVRHPADRPARRRSDLQQPRRLGAARPGLRDQHHGEVPRSQAGDDQEVSQGSPARRRRRSRPISQRRSTCSTPRSSTASTSRS